MQSFAEELSTGATVLMAKVSYLKVQTPISGEVLSKTLTFLVQDLDALQQQVATESPSGTHFAQTNDAAEKQTPSQDIETNLMSFALGLREPMATAMAATIKELEISAHITSLSKTPSTTTSAGVVQNQVEESAQQHFVQKLVPNGELSGGSGKLVQNPASRMI